MAEKPGNQFGWRAHEAVQSWTASVDAKASIVLVVEVAVAGAAVHTLVGSHDELGRAGGLHLVVALLALIGLGLAVVCALAVVFPRLARRRTSATPPNGLLYFGHLRQRSPDSISLALKTMDAGAERRQLAEQLHITAKVAWRKHSWLQASLAFLALGSLGLLVSLLAYPEPRPPVKQRQHNSTPIEVRY